MEKPSSESQDLRELEEEMTIVLAIPRSTNNTALFQLVSHLRKVCRSYLRSAGITHIGYAGIGTFINIPIYSSSFTDILDIISGIPGVDKVEECPSGSNTFFRFIKKVASRQSLTSNRSKMVHVILGETCIARQGQAIV